LGSIPARVQLFRAYRIRLGLRIKFRKEGEHNWQFGWIYEVHENGYFKMVKDKGMAIQLIKDAVQLPHLPKIE